MKKKLRRAYLAYNRRYFGGRLPKDLDLTWEQLPANLLGYQEGDYKIAINAKLHRADVLWRSTLIHEMTHLELGHRVQHGPKFQKRMRELAAAGAFDGLW
jgi:hypothetical protein